MSMGRSGINPDEVRISSGQLGGFPIISSFLRKLKVRETIDSALPMHPQNHVSHGECVEALVLSILRENHALVNVSETLTGFDLAKVFDRPGIQPEHFNDTRLGQSLDALHENHDRLFGNLALNAIRGYHLETRRTHIDSTSIKVYGAYEDEAGFRFPLLARRGHSKDHRPDLKQFMFSMSVNEDGVPLVGRMIDGNSSDNEEFRWHLAQLDEALAGMRDTVMVADCKLCTYETMLMALKRDLSILTLLPETFSLQRQLRESASQEDLPLLYTSDAGYRCHGRSYVVPHAWKTDSGEERLSQWRYLVVHSEELANRKAEIHAYKRDEERKRIDKLLAGWGKEAFACLPDAEKVAQDKIATLDPQYHGIEFRVTEGQVPAKRGRGRPKGPPEMISGFIIHAEARVKEPAQKAFSPDSMFVLVTNIADRRRLSDERMLTSYKEQWVIESAFKWLKGPAAISPIYLKRPSRVKVLGFVYLIALMISALVQRELRRGLARRGGKCPHGYYRTETPTTVGIMKLFQSIGFVAAEIQGQKRADLQRFKPEHAEVLELLGIPGLYEEVIHGAEKPTPGM
jgi:transposase